MAISAPHYQLLKSLKPILPRAGSLLEIGEANWYGDVDPKMLYVDYSCNGTGGYLAEVLPSTIKSGDKFAIAKAFYATLFNPSRIVSVDFNGTPTALRLDLNKPLPLEEEFDVVINHGTAEHIFNIAQVFQTVHDRTLQGGLMIHESPFTGWVDHGFYCLQPTLFYDLAAANCYEIVLVALETIKPPHVIRLNDREHVIRLAKSGDLPDNAMLFVVFRKVVDRPFRIPMQGYYSQGLGPAGVKAWEEMR